MEPSVGAEDSDDAEVFASRQQTPTDVFSPPTGYLTTKQQYDAGSSGVPMWSECVPVSTSPFLRSTDADTHAAAVDFISTVGQGKKTFLHTNFQSQVYNFLERPTGWKCFLYHFSV